MTIPDCHQAHPLLSAAIDGELDPAAQAALDRHLAGCDDCRKALEEQKAFRDTLRSVLTRHQAPDGLHARLMASLPEEKPQPTVSSRPRRRWSHGAWAGSALALAASIVLFVSVPSHQDEMTRELVAAHVRSLMPGHLIDVPSSDQHTVKPWFNGRVDLSPPVPDLSEAGFPLLGGRLDYIEERPSAVLVYGRRQHRINLFVWPEPGRDRAVGQTQRNGYTVLSWRQGDIAYAAVSDLAAEELADFRRLWQGKAQEGP
ncbi:anti-sigma factor [Telmatospirillum sp.]|uniref:anti-sigma factor family protein n=1 Tax=Telmatospirillum sp. TaxID=2079197 RepID=UPI0028422326|nr:anti-sigma factor [Telmatospirillum sp.]MDR3437044.1 anti-sigma factor [Telmatospirillum sp.]